MEEVEAAVHGVLMDLEHWEVSLIMTGGQNRNQSSISILSSPGFDALADI